MKKKWSFFSALLLNGFPGACVRLPSWCIAGRHHHINRLIAYPSTKGFPGKAFAYIYAAAVVVNDVPAGMPGVCH